MTRGTNTIQRKQQYRHQLQLHGSVHINRNMNLYDHAVYNIQFLLSPLSPSSNHHERARHPANSTLLQSLCGIFNTKYTLWNQLYVPTGSNTTEAWPVILPRQPSLGLWSLSRAFATQERQDSWQTLEYEDLALLRTQRVL